MIAQNGGGRRAERGKCGEGRAQCSSGGSVDSLTLDPNLLFAQIKGHANIYPNSTDREGGEVERPATKGEAFGGTPE